MDGGKNPVVLRNFGLMGLQCRPAFKVEIASSDGAGMGCEINSICADFM